MSFTLTSYTQRQHTYTEKHTYTHTQIHTCIHACIHTYTDTQKRDTHVHTYTHIHTCIHAFIHTYTHNTHTHTNTYKLTPHSHTCSQPVSQPSPSYFSPPTSDSRPNISLIHTHICRLQLACLRYRCGVRFGRLPRLTCNKVCLIRYASHVTNT